MKTIKQQKEVLIDEAYTDQEINDLAEWFEGLTIKQLFFLKYSYEALMALEAEQVGNGHVH